MPDEPRAGPAIGVAEAGTQARFLFILGLCGFCSSLTLRSLDPMLPLISAEFGIDAHAAALLASAYALTYAVGQLFLGALGDAVGKARMISICVVLLAAGLLASAAAPDFASLLAIRAFSGVVGGGVIPLCLALIGDRFPVAIRQVALGRFLFVSISGQMLGAAVGGIVAEAVGWRGVFVGSGLIALTIGVAAMAVLRPRPGAERRPFGLATVLAGNSEVLHSRGAIAFYLVVFLEGALVFAALPFVAAFLADRDGVSASGAGLVLAGLGVGTIAYTTLVGPLLRLLGTAGLRLWGGLIAGASLALFAVPVPFPLPAVFLFGLGFGFLMLHNTLQMTATELAPRVRGTALSVFAMMLFLGQGLGPILFGGAATLIGIPASIVSVGILLAALGVAAAAGVRRA